jgi:diadenosine tetraphosphate (Ap4A) HIT family hydrolase
MIKKVKFGKIPMSKTNQVFNTGKVFAFVPNKPILPGHLVLCPVKDVPCYADL